MNTIELALVIGYAAQSEVVPRRSQELSEQRATYVKELMTKYGMHGVEIWAEGKGLCQPKYLPLTNQKNGRVELEFMGRLNGSFQCKLPRDPGGFHYFEREKK